MAHALQTGGVLKVAYYYGTFMPEQEGPTLTVAIYSGDEKHGILFDLEWERRKYFVANLPPLLLSANHWRVGEINGGLWSYTRLWYLAQEIGARPKQTLSVREILEHKPQQCNVFVFDQTNWKPGAEKYVGDSVRQATPINGDKSPYHQ